MVARYVVLTVAVLAGIPAWAAKPFSLAEAVEAAVARSPVLDAARKELEIGELRESSARAKFLPSADFSATNGLISSGVGGSAPWSSQFGLNLTENIYDNSVSLTQYRAAGFSRELAEVAFRKTRAQLALDVATQFYQASLGQKLLEARTRQVELLRKQFDAVSTGFRQGMKTRQDYLRFKTQVQRAEIDLISAKDTVRSTETELRRLLGGEEAEFARLEVQGKPAVPKEGPAIAATYDAHGSDLQKRANALNVDLASRRYWPQLNVTGGVAYTDTRAPFATNGTTWNALVTLDFNLWDWGIRRRDVAVARKTELAQGDQLDAGLLSVAASISNLMQDLARRKAELELDEELLGLSRESLELLEEQYRLGKLTYLDIVTGLNDLLDAETRFNTAYFGLLQSLAKYRYYEGTLYETLSRRT